MAFQSVWYETELPAEIIQILENVVSRLLAGSLALAGVDTPGRLILH